MDGRVDEPAGRRSRFLDGVERLGNALPDPIFIFVAIILVLVIVSVIGASAGWSAVNPVTGETLVVSSLLSEANVEKLFVEMPRTYTGFAPLGFALTIMLGASVAEKSGLLTALMRASLGGAPKNILVPMVFVLGMLATHANDAAYMVYVPLAGIVFAAAGRHPVLGLIAGWSGAAVGLSGNLFPGQYDVLLLGITETGARLLDPAWTMNPLGNWYFSIGIAVVFTAVGWWVLERVIAPRLGAWNAEGVQADLAGMKLTSVEKTGLIWAGVAALGVAGLATALVMWPGFTPLMDEAASGSQQMTPFFRSIAALLFLLFLSTGWAYGAATGSIKSHRDVVAMMVERAGRDPALSRADLLRGALRGDVRLVEPWAHHRDCGGGPVARDAGAAGCSAAAAGDDVGVAGFPDCFRIGKMGGHGAGGDADDDAVGHLAGDDDGRLSRWRYGDEPDLAAQSLCDPDHGVRPALHAGFPARHDDRAGAAAGGGVLCRGHAADGGMGGAGHSCWAGRAGGLSRTGFVAQATAAASASGAATLRSARIFAASACWSTGFER